MLNQSNIFDVIKQNANLYWPGFQLVAAALYDCNGIYLYNHPHFSSQEKPYSFLPWNEEFNGANTLTLYNDYPTAIVNKDYYNEMESVYSIMVHELFHGYQYLQGENRFPDELAGMNYPLHKENIELRNRERRYLYRAGISTDRGEKVHNLKRFVECREARRTYIDNYLDYECAVETIEGPAFYVEFQAYTDISSTAKEEHIKTFGRDLIDSKESSQFIRRSCYSSGFMICCLLDEFVPNWRGEFFSANKPLYEILKEEVNGDLEKIEQVNVSAETTSIIAEIIEDRKAMFEQFEKQAGYHIYITGDMERDTFDPMNVIVRGKMELHQKFITILLNDREYTIRQPAIAYYNHLNKLEKLHLVLQVEPISSNGITAIDGVGDINGILYEKNGAFYLQIDRKNLDLA